MSSLTNLYSFLVLFELVLIILCRQVFFLTFSIVLYLFLSLTNAFHRWSSWYFIHLCSLFFIIVLCCLRSSSYHGFGFLLVVLTFFSGAMSSRALSTSFVKWFMASSSVVLLRTSLSLNFSLNMLFIFFVGFLPLVVIVWGSNLFIVVSNISSLWSEMYGPGTSSPTLLNPVLFVVIITSRVCPLLCVGILTCCDRLKAFIESCSMDAFRLVGSSIYIFVSPSIIMLLYLDWSDVKRSVNWSINVVSENS